MTRARAFCLALALGAAAMAAAGTAHAQQRATTGSGGDATDIVAGQGIEWQRDKKVYIARGGVVVTRGDSTLQADQITAYYRDGGGKSKIFRIDAVGNVTWRARDSVASGDVGVYDLDNKVMTLKGRNLSYVAPNSKVTARDSLEWWEDKRYAVARGNAVAVNEDDLIRADILIAYFNERGGPGAKPDPADPNQPKQKKNSVLRYEGQGNVVVESKDNVARGQHLLYDVATQKATLSGDGKPVTGTFTPKSDDDDKPAGGDNKDKKDADKNKPAGGTGKKP